MYNKKIDIIPPKGGMCAFFLKFLNTKFTEYFHKEHKYLNIN